MKLYLLIASYCLISILFGCKKSTLDNKTTTIIPEYAKKQLTVIMISVDGFRPDYLELPQASDLKKLSEKGVKADYMLPRRFNSPMQLFNSKMRRKHL
jgi:predicted AlkP superfamily pyrophosphatase or phosphodiesterase